MSIHKILSSPNPADPISYEGQATNLWFNPTDNTLRVSDGVTPGGIRIGSGGGNPSGHDCGAFYSTQTQTNLLPSNTMTMDVTQISANISVVGGSRITFANSGNRYNIQFSAQLDKTDSGQDNMEIWLSKNGVDEPWSNTSVDVDNNNGRVVAAWNFVVEPSAGDYYELMWHSTDPDIRLYSQIVATRPAIPSLILTVTQC